MSISLANEEKGEKKADTDPIESGHRMHEGKTAILIGGQLCLGR